ncbi:MAG: ACP S-malonyltransferase [Bacillota bacterium]
MGKIAFLFPGQGSQYTGMGKTFYDNYSIARETFEEANDVLKFNLKELCFEGNLEELTRTENTQPAILTASVAAFRVYMHEIGVMPDLMAGHSLGEFSALTCAEVIRFSDALGIVRKRGLFMQGAVPVGVGAMSAVAGLEAGTVEEVCSSCTTQGELVVVSNYNSSEQLVISGHKSAVLKAGEKLSALGAKVIPLKVSAPFHSPLMITAADRLKEELEKYNYSDFICPVVSNVTALPYRGKEDVVEKLVSQIVSPVQWIASMEFIKSEGITLAVEMGPKNVLKNLMKKNTPGIKAYSFDDKTDFEAFKEAITIKPVPTAWVGEKAALFLSKCIATAVCTKNRNWNDDEYQKGVVEPYRRIQKIYDELERSGKEPTIDQMRDALEMLRSVFITKKVPVEESMERFNEIFDETGTRELFPDFIMGMGG